MKKQTWIARVLGCAVGLSLAADAAAQNRYYFQGPFGPGGTYNLYELKGIGGLTFEPGQYINRYAVENSAPLTVNTGSPAVWWEAHNAAAATTETVTGANLPAHLVAFSGPTAKAENDFVHQQAFLGDFWIGLSDDEKIGNGAAETATGNPEADGIRGLNNATPGWRWTNGEVFDFANWGGGEPNNAGGGEDAVFLRGDGLWSDIGDGRDGESLDAYKYIYEYETHSTAPLSIPNSLQLSRDASPTPGGKGGLGFVSIREVHSQNTISGNAGALSLLYGSIQSDVEVNYTATTINKNNLVGAVGIGGGNFDDDDEWGLVSEGALPPGDINNFAMRAHGYVRVPVGGGGQYTFNVNTDDSGELWIYEKSFEGVTNGTRTAYGSMAYLNDRGAAPTLGVITLESGKDYEFEYVMNENGGGSAAELSVAKGVHTEFNLVDFRLVGGDPTPIDYIGGTTPRISSDFQLKEVKVQPEDSRLINTMADAKALLNAPDGDDRVYTGTSTTVNFHDPTTNATPSGHFGTGDVPFLNDTSTNPPDFDDNNFVLNAKTQIIVETEGDYTFGFDSDDGSEIILEGANFTHLFGPGVANGNALTADLLTGASLSAAWTHLLPGTYDLEYTMFERGGGAFAELFVAPGRAPAFSTEFFSLLSPTTTTVASRHIAGALQFGDGSWLNLLVGDTDGDGDVDGDDLNNVRNNFGSFGLGDTDGDADVDLDDLNNVRNNFGTTAPNPVPEPSTLALVGACIVVWFAARSRSGFPA